MKKMLLSVLIPALFASYAPALDIGDPAPEISVDRWVSGEPADPAKIDGKTIYLVEVWSTTCPPCARSIPILASLQARYADAGLKIVSFTSDSPEEVEEYLADHAIGYSSFIDKDGGSMVKYMAADNRDTIPHAFLFDRSGALVWIGNPLDNLESRIRKVIDGSLNRENALALRDALEEAKDGLNLAIEGQDVSAILASLRRLEELEPDNPQYYQWHHRLLIQVGIGDAQAMAGLFRDWFAGCRDQPEGLAALALAAIGMGEPQSRDPRLALAAAKRAYAIGGGLRLETGLNLADIYKDIGRLDLALNLLDELAGETDGAEALAGVRRFYESLIELGKNPDAEYRP
ncbi:MAG: TlpA family protein disulfide reductase [Planctomycetota bacterium]|nr:TlpA family protein disulfide reductase [Planctomycetota bacterium]